MSLENLVSYIFIAPWIYPLHFVFDQNLIGNRVDLLVYFAIFSLLYIVLIVLVFLFPFVSGMRGWVSYLALFSLCYMIVPMFFSSVGCLATIEKFIFREVLNENKFILFVHDNLLSTVLPINLFFALFLSYIVIYPLHEVLQRRLQKRFIPEAVIIFAFIQVWVIIFI